MQAQAGFSNMSMGRGGCERAHVAERAHVQACTFGGCAHLLTHERGATRQSGFPPELAIADVPLRHTAQYALCAPATNRMTCIDPRYVV